MSRKLVLYHLLWKILLILFLKKNSMKHINKGCVQIISGKMGGRIHQVTQVLHGLNLILCKKLANLIRFTVHDSYGLIWVCSTFPISIRISKKIKKLFIIFYVRYLKIKSHVWLFMEYINRMLMIDLHFIRYGIPERQGGCWEVVL